MPGRRKNRRGLAPGVVLSLIVQFPSDIRRRHGDGDRGSIARRRVRSTECEGHCYASLNDLILPPKAYRGSSLCRDLKGASVDCPSGRSVCRRLAAWVDEICVGRDDCAIARHFGIRMSRVQAKSHEGDGPNDRLLVGRGLGADVSAPWLNSARSA